MTKAVWAIFYHKISTNESPRNENCPQGAESWCSWQRAKAEDSLDNYQHAQPLYPDVIKAIEPIYIELSKRELLEWCLGAFNQSSNESLNAVIWKLAPKIMFSDTAVVETAINLATIFFNDGHVGFMKILQELGVNNNKKLYEYCLEIDEQHITVANKRAQKAAEEASFHRRYSNIQFQDELMTVKELLYGPGIAD